MRNIACFDIGGTFIKYAIIDEEGSILFKDKFPSPRENCKETIPKILIEKTNKLKEKYKIHAVGISTAGQVDSEKGEIIFATDNLPGYTGAKLSENIFKGTGLTVKVENDVNAAALGEMWKGSGRDLSTFFCMTLGTGIGGAIIINRKLYKGIGGSAGEVGHIVINENGEPCTCGSQGCYERYASTSALIREYIRRSKELGVPHRYVDGEIIMKKVHEGEALAKEIYDEFISHIASGIATITHLLDPGTIIVGGGISAQGDKFFIDLNKKFKNRIMKSYGKYTKIIPAELQNDAGIYGACFIAL